MLLPGSNDSLLQAQLPPRLEIVEREVQVPQSLVRLDDLVIDRFHLTFQLLGCKVSFRKHFYI
jgi:hypothetical protein